MSALPPADIGTTKGRGILLSAALTGWVRLQTADVCRKHGTSEATSYKYKAKLGGMEASDPRQLKALKDENAKLKKLFADHAR